VALGELKILEGICLIVGEGLQVSHIDRKELSQAQSINKDSDRQERQVVSRGWLSGTGLGPEIRISLQLNGKLILFNLFAGSNVICQRFELLRSFWIGPGDDLVPVVDSGARVYVIN